MKNLTKLGFLVLLIAITLASCKKEIITEPEVIKPDGVALKKAISGKRATKTQSFTVDMSVMSGVEITGEQGTKVFFYPGMIKDAQGNIVTGNIDLTMLEIYSKADMLLMNKTTMGEMPGGSHGVLVSGGELLIKASQSGEDLELTGQINIRFPVANTGVADNDMVIFKGDETEEDCGTDIICEDDVWLEEDSANMFIETFGALEYYNAFINQFGWTNIDRFYSDTTAKSKINVQAPTGYDNSNCAIYISYDGEPSALGSLDTYSASDNLFSEHYGLLPDINFHLVAVSIVDDVYYSSITQVAAGSDWASGSFLVTIDDLVQTTEAALTTEINNLP